jgi:hypothetical protein
VQSVDRSVDAFETLEGVSDVRVERHLTSHNGLIIERIYR